MKKNYVLFLLVFLVLSVIGFYAFSKGNFSITGNVVRDSEETDFQNNLDEINQGNTKINSGTFKNKDDSVKDLMNVKNQENYKLQSVLISDILKLREATNSKNIIDIAFYYSKIDAVLRNSSFSNSWSVVADCSYTSCNDKVYLDLIDAIVSSDIESGKNKVTHFLIQTYYLWNSKNEALFSKSLTQTNLLISNEKEEIVLLWKELVSCNGCDKMPEIVMKIIVLLYD